MSVTNPDTEDLKSEKATSLSVSRLTDVLCQYFRTVLLMRVAPRLRSHTKINEQLLFAKMNLPDHTVPLALWIRQEFPSICHCNAAWPSFIRRRPYHRAPVLTLTPQWFASRSCARKQQRQMENLFHSVGQNKHLSERKVKIRHWISQNSAYGSQKPASRFKSCPKNINGVFAKWKCPSAHAAGDACLAAWWGWRPAFNHYRYISVSTCSPWRGEGAQCGNDLCCNYWASKSLPVCVCVCV